MHRGAIVPQDNIAGAPAVKIDVTALCRLIDQLREERPAPSIVHALVDERQGVPSPIRRIQRDRGPIDARDAVERPTDQTIPFCPDEHLARAGVSRPARRACANSEWIRHKTAWTRR